MKLIVDIPDNWEEELNQSKITFADVVDIDTIRNGTPLDKHDEEVIAETVESIWGKPPYIELLDKLRAEIESLPRELPTDARNMVRRTRVFDIIDKYKAGK